MLEQWASVIIAIVVLAIFLGVAASSGYWTKQQLVNPNHELVSAHRTQPWWSLACSFFAAAFGCSVLAANPEAGAVGSWIQVVAYGLANGAPYWILVIVGPKIQDILKMEGFTVADFVGKRFGLPMQIPVWILSLFFMFIWLAAELTSVGAAFTTISPDLPLWVAPFLVCVMTGAYALTAGFRASILTDRFQSAAAIILLVIILAGIGSSVSIEKKAFQEASTVHAGDLVGALVLIISTTTNQFLDLGSWQRAFASQDKKQAQLGCLVAGSVNFLCQAAVAATGVVAVAAKLSGVIEIPDGMEFNSLFFLLAKCPIFFEVAMLIFAITLAASTVDSIQNGIACPFVSVSIKTHWFNMQVARLFAILIIVPALLLSLLQVSVISLFLVSNIFSLAVVPPMFMGLSPYLATTSGALSGLICGILAVFACGWAYTGDFVGGLKWPMFPAGFNDISTLVTFLVVPAVAASVTFAVSTLQLRGQPELLEQQRERLLELELATPRSPSWKDDFAGRTGLITSRSGSIVVSEPSVAKDLV